MSQDELRKAARKRLERKAAFWQFFGVAVVVSVLLVVIWAMSNPGGYFWPVWPMLGLGIALVFSAFDAFGPGRGYISEERIDAEVRKMTGGGAS